MKKIMMSAAEEYRLQTYYKEEIKDEIIKYFSEQLVVSNIRETIDKYLEITGCNNKQFDGVEGNIKLRHLALSGITIGLINPCYNELSRIDGLFDEISKDLPPEDKRIAIWGEIKKDLDSMRGVCSKKIYASDFDSELTKKRFIKR